MRQFLLLLALSLPCQLAAEEALELEPMRARVCLLDGGRYERAVVQSLAAAEKRIDCMLYLVSLPEEPSAGHPVRRLLDTLIARHEAGIEVRVLLDSAWEYGGEERDSKNDRAARYLARAGVAVRWDELERRTHSKSLCIDGRYCVIGSTNWSWSALRENREQAVLMDSRALGQRFAVAFAPAWAAGTPMGRQPDSE